MDDILTQLDPIEGAEILGLMGITSDDYVISKKFDRVKEIIRFFQGVQDKSFLIKKVLAGKDVDKIDHLYEYTQLRIDYAEKKGKIETLRQKLNETLEVGQDVEKHLEQVQDFQDLNRITEEIELYEK